MKQDIEDLPPPTRLLPSSTLSLMEVLYGVHPVEEALKAGRRRFDRVLVAEERHDPRMDQLVARCREAGVRVSQESREQLTLYQDDLPQFEALHGQILGISADHMWCHAAFCREAGITFPLLADTPPNGRVSQLYGVYRIPEDVTGRALFVIDSSGIIRFGEVYPNLLNPGVDDVLTTLESL